MAIPNIRLLVACGILGLLFIDGACARPAPPPLLYWEPGGRARLLEKSPFLASKTRSGTPVNGWEVKRALPTWIIICFWIIICYWYMRRVFSTEDKRNREDNHRLDLQISGNIFSHANNYLLMIHDACVLKWGQRNREDNQIEFCRFRETLIPRRQLE